MKVLLFRGCKAFLDRPDIGEKAAELLKKLGHEVILLDKEECCGAPYVIIGDIEDFKKHAKKMQDRFNQVDADVIVTLCPNCAKTLSYLYEKYGFKLKHPVMHIVKFIHEELVKNKIEFKKPVNMKVTYHDACVLVRHFGYINEPREILNRIPGLQYVEMPEDVSKNMTKCCGGGGVVSLALPELSMRVAIDRLEKDVNPLGVEALITPCPNCTLTLTKGAEIAKSEGRIGDLKVLHIVELLYEAVAGE